MSKVLALESSMWNFFSSENPFQGLDETKPKQNLKIFQCYQMGGIQIFVQNYMVSECLCKGVL